MDFNLIQFFLMGIGLFTATVAFVLIILEYHKEKKQNKKIIQNTNEIGLIEGSLLQNVKETSTQMESDVDKILHKIAAIDIKSMKESTNSFESSYAKELEDLNQQLHKLTSDAVQNTQKTYTDKLNSFIDELVKGGLSTQTMVDKKTAELLAISDQEISEYKKRRMEKIDQEVKELLDKVYRDVLKSSIPESLQNELILKSLEDAKRDGLFKL